MRSGEVVEPLPFVEFRFEINVTFVAGPLLEYLSLGATGRPLGSGAAIRAGSGRSDRTGLSGTRV